MRWVDAIHVGDCVDLMRQMPADHVDLVVTSPPYDDLRKYDSGATPFGVTPVAQGLWSVLKPGGVVVWVTSDKTIRGSESLSSFRHAIAFCDAGFRLHDTMIYAKSNPIPLNHRRYEQAFEYMFIFSKGTPKSFNPIRIPISSPRPVQKDVHHTKNYRRGTKLRGHRRDKLKSNIWTYAIGKNCSTKDSIAFQHPAIFPEQLASDHIASWSNSDDLVFDPMCGSGTTLKAAAILGRRYLGFDLSQKYVDIARERVGVI